MSARSSTVVAILLAWVAGSVAGSVGAEPTASAGPLAQIARAHAEYVPSLVDGEPVFVLVIGGDAREGDDSARSLADSIHVIATDGSGRTATIVGIPRDSWVRIPGVGMNKINAALSQGGPSLLVRTVEDLMGIRIGYYALATFWGLPAAVDAVGGVTVKIPCPMQDSFAQPGFEPGRQQVNGAQALAFSRDRHSFAEGDLARSENGGRLLLGTLAEFHRQFAEDPSRLLAWLAAGLANVQTDIPLWELALLAFTASAIDPAEVQNIVLPATPGMESSLYVVHIDPAARAIYADLAGSGGVRPRHVPDSPTEGCRAGAP